MKKRKPDFSKPKPVAEKSDALEEAVAVASEAQNSDDTDSDSADTARKEKEIKSKRNSATDKFFPDKIYYNLPLVVIAGRPNVGKSTLFNALTHTHRAITDPTPGVTRDPIEGTAFINGMPVHLMDTGGYKLTRDTGTNGSGDG